MPRPYLVASFAARLRRSGLEVPPVTIPDPEHRLYRLLAAEEPDAAHGRYNFRLWSSFRAIEPNLYRFPAISPAAFRRALEAAISPES